MLGLSMSRIPIKQNSLQTTKVYGTDLKPGVVFLKNGKILKVVDRVHMKLSKGGACLQLKCKNIATDNMVEERINVDESVETLFIEKDIISYQYTDGDLGYFMMDDNSVEININQFGIFKPIFEENCTIQEIPDIKIEYFSDKQGSINVVNAELMDDLKVKILDTRPSIKGEQAKTSGKNATVEAGISVIIPAHLNTNDYIYLKKSTLEYDRKV